MGWDGVDSGAGGGRREDLCCNYLWHACCCSRHVSDTVSFPCGRYVLHPCLTQSLSYKGSPPMPHLELLWYLVLSRSSSGSAGTSAKGVFSRLATVKTVSTSLQNER